jgi:hypothetical protein
MRPMIVAALFALAACAPTPTPDAARADAGQGGPTPPTAAQQADCGRRGGEMRRVGLSGSYQCIVAYADAGKRCTDGDQCQGDCRADAGLPPPPRNGEPAVPERSAAPAGPGRCQADSSPFGCYATVEDGRAGPAVCVD